MAKKTLLILMLMIFLSFGCSKSHKLVFRDPVTKHPLVNTNVEILPSTGMWWPFMVGGCPGLWWMPIMGESRECVTDSKGEVLFAMKQPLFGEEYWQLRIKSNESWFTCWDYHYPKKEWCDCEFSPDDKNRQKQEKIKNVHVEVKYIPAK